MFQSASSYRMTRAVGGLASLGIAVGMYFLYPTLGLDTAKFNRKSAEGTPQRTIIEALVSMRDDDLGEATWKGTLCHEAACDDFDTFASTHLSPSRSFAPECLVDGEKIQMKPPGGKLIDSLWHERLFWVRCQGGDAWLEVSLKPEKRPIPGNDAELPWLITSMRRVEKVPAPK
ncbi:MAG: hypothetical protein VYE40_06990 [Myxococcota bacterium]|nr:hypothetical protein [Myxococcota bacterium]